VDQQAGLEHKRVRDHRVVVWVGVFLDLQVLLDLAAGVGKKRPLRADRAPELIGFEDVVGGDCDDLRVRDKLEQLVNGLPSLKVDDAVDFRSASDIYRAARRAGKTIRSINDCLIAALSIRHDANFIHREADFDVIATLTAL
jgi:predicted nucleic acid-binding protein